MVSRVLKICLQLEDAEGYTIISDMQKVHIFIFNKHFYHCYFSLTFVFYTQGMVSAMQFPRIHHQLCVRYVFAAWAKKWRGIERKKAF